MNTTRLQEKIEVAGHLQEKRGIYQMIFSWKLPDGKRDRKSFSTGLPVKGNKGWVKLMLRSKCDEMSDILTAQLQSKVHEMPDDKGNMLFADFMEHCWLVAIKTEVKQTTYGGYWFNVTKAIAP